MWGYQGRIERDLDRWREAGWLTPEGDTRIRAELALRRPRYGLSGALAVLGALLLGFAAMSFVAANWQEMSKLARLMLLFASIIAAYGTAGALFVRGLASFAHAALVLGVALFGASIMLIAQMYHMDGNPPDVVLVWAGGALLTGAALGSNPALSAAMLLACLWTGWEVALTSEVHWLFLPVWAAVTAAMAWREWSAGLLLAGVAISVWIVALGYLFNDGHAHELVTLLGLAILAAGVVLVQRQLHLPLQPQVIAGFGMAIAFAGSLALQFVEVVSTGRLIVLSALTLAALLAAIYWGFRTGMRNVLWLGYTGFSIEILALYFKTIGTLMGSSLFFLVTGLLVIGLAVVAFRLHERQEASGGGMS
ncbi:MAG: DUF2157 domain-containing protein [Hyphomicrobium sp.]|nr:DUF2157 domain-containing protein [Hyphomicrobium sp.]PPC81186.1 MAG: hypothetical protein CTY40_07625 [Hyphomicrobium sp.]